MPLTVSRRYGCTKYGAHLPVLPSTLKRCQSDRPFCSSQNDIDKESRMVTTRKGYDDMDKKRGVHGWVKYLSVS